MISLRFYQGSNARLAKLATTCKDLQNLQGLLQVVNLLNINEIKPKLANLQNLQAKKRVYHAYAHTHVYTREKLLFFFASFASFTYN